MSDTPTETLAPARTFADFGVSAPIVEALSAVGIVSPFPIQEMTLPVALAGHDIIGQAKTGTGKTLGFGIPLLEHLSGPGEPGWDDLAEPGKPQALVVAPTRELAVQVAQDLAVASKKRSVRVLQIYGGRAYEPQIEALNKGIEVVVGTPGRMIDLMKQGHLDLRYVKTVVLDEADEMLDLGFLPDVEKLLAATPASRHTMLFSATMPGAVVALARRYMIQPTHIRASSPEDSGATVKAIKQFVYRAHAMDKIEVLARVLQSKDRGLTIVFARTKRTTAKVADELAARGFAAGRDPRRPRSGRARAGAPRVQVRKDRCARRDGRRRARHRRRRRHARRQLPVPRGPEDLPAPHRPHRPRGQDRRRGHVRRLGRPSPVGPDRQGARPRLPRARGDVLQLAAPIRGA